MALRQRPSASAAFSAKGLGFDSKDLKASAASVLEIGKARPGDPCRDLAFGSAVPLISQVQILRPQEG